MLQTVEAIIDADGNVRLLGDVAVDASRRALVIVLDEPAAVPGKAAPIPAAGGPAMAAALGNLAAVGGPSGFGDPAEWQREARAERPLPGREG